MFSSPPIGNEGVGAEEEVVQMDIDEATKPRVKKRHPLPKPDLKEDDPEEERDQDDDSGGDMSCGEPEGEEEEKGTAKEGKDLLEKPASERHQPEKRPVPFQVGDSDDSGEEGEDHSASVQAMEVSSDFEDNGYAERKRKRRPKKQKKAQRVKQTFEPKRKSRGQDAAAKSKKRFLKGLEIVTSSPATTAVEPPRGSSSDASASESSDIYPAPPAQGLSKGRVFICSHITPCPRTENVGQLKQRS